MNYLVQAKLIFQLTTALYYTSHRMAWHGCKILFTLISINYLGERISHDWLKSKHQKPSTLLSYHHDDY
jgi:hypothetical protein